MDQRLIIGKRSRAPAPRVWVARERNRENSEDQPQDEADNPEGAHP